MANNAWLSGGTRHKGSLHTALGIREGTKITAKELNKGFNAKNAKLRNEALSEKSPPPSNKGK